MEKYLDLRRKAMKHTDILNDLHIDNNLVSFWKDRLTRQSYDFFKELEEINMDLVIDAIRDGKSKAEACEIADITMDNLEEMLQKGQSGEDQYVLFNSVFGEIYFKDRREDFLNHLKSNDYVTSIELAGLEKSEVDNWYDSSQTDFAFGHRDDNSFFIKTTRLLMNLYVNARNLKKSQKEACSLIDKTTYDVKRWLNIEEEPFINFKNELEDVMIDNVAEGFNAKMSVAEISKSLDITQNRIWDYIECGKNGEQKCIKVYESYLNSYVLTQLDEFLVQIKDKPKHKVLKAISLTEEEFDRYYKLGCEGDEKFRAFAEEYHDFKVSKYINSIIKGRNESKALRNADLEIAELPDDIDDMILKRRMVIVLEEIAKDKTTKQAAKKANITVDEIYDWFLKGRAGDEEFKDFADYYYEEYVEIGSKFVQDALEEGIPIKFILKKSKENFTREDYEFWKKNNFLKKNYEINMDDKDEINEKLKKEILGDE